MDNTKALTAIFMDHLELGENCHGFEVQGDRVELWLCMQGYKYYEKYISVEEFNKCFLEYF